MGPGGSVRSESCSLLGAVSGLRTPQSAHRCSHSDGEWSPESRVLGGSAPKTSVRPIELCLAALDPALLRPFCHSPNVLCTWSTKGVGSCCSLCFPPSFPGSSCAGFEAHRNAPLSYAVLPTGQSASSCLLSAQLHPVPRSANVCVCPPSQRPSSLPGHCSRRAGVPRIPHAR